MQERRKINRKFLSYFIRVFDGDSREQIGNLVDITPQGVMLLSPKPIAKNSIIHMRLEVTPDVSDKPYLEFSARAKWCRPDIEPSMYNIGFKILKLGQEDVEVVQRINDSFGFRENRPVP
jgi:hypothetical protein